VKLQRKLVAELEQRASKAESARASLLVEKSTWEAGAAGGSAAETRAREAEETAAAGLELLEHYQCLPYWNESLWGSIFLGINVLCLSPRPAIRNGAGRSITSRRRLGDCLHTAYINHQ
jgi:hypothetical protein